MTLKSALITLATVAGIACFAGQDPRLDYSFAAPKYDDTDAAPSPKQTQWTATAKDAPSKAVSVTFRNATITEVLAWLKKQGVSYVMDEAIVRDKRISVNLENQPLSAVMDAIAVAMNGHWTRKGGIYVYRPGGMSFFPEAGLAVPSVQGYPDPKDLQGRAWVAPKVDIDVKRLEELGTRMPKAYTFTQPDQKELAEKIAKEVLEALKASKVDDPAFWERFSKELSESIEKNLKQNRVFMRGFGDGFKLEPGTIEGLKDLEVIVGKSSGARTVDAERFIETVTPAQRDLMKSQGYLKVSDLTAAQREMLHITDAGEGDLNLVFVVKGEKIVIKSK